MKKFKNAFEEMYNQKVIHRDIKPENILMHNGTIKIGDFGFARIVDDMNEELKMTRLGTPKYSSMYFIIFIFINIIIFFQ